MTEDDGVHVMDGEVVQVEDRTGDGTIEAITRFDASEVPETVPAEEWLRGAEVEFRVSAEPADDFGTEETNE